LNSYTDWVMVWYAPRTSSIQTPRQGCLHLKHAFIRDAKMQNHNAPALGLNAICRTVARCRWALRTPLTAFQCQSSNPPQTSRKNRN